MRKPIALLLLGFVAAASDAKSTATLQSTPESISKDVVPRSYLVHLEPNIDTRLTDGVESIEIEVLKATNRIVLNAVDTKVVKATIEVDGHQEELAPQLDLNQQTVSFDLEDVLPPGKYSLSLKFQSRIFEQRHGLFLQASEDEVVSVAERFLATEASAADTRRIFPCWDEPAFPAVFQLSVKIGTQNTAISNMPVAVVQSLGPDQKIVVFEETPAITSDTLFLISGKLALLDDEIAGVKLRVLTLSGKTDRAKYAMEVTKQLLPFFSDYFTSPFPLAKLDQIAFPSGSDEIAGNLGELFYDEEDLLCDPENSSEATRQRIFLAIAKKIARQRYDTLVAVPMQKDLWLKEAFASWIALKAADHFNPQWRIWLHTAVTKEAAMASDAAEMTPAIQSPTPGAEQTGEAPAAIKRQPWLLFRMLESFSGEDAFREGVRAFLGTRRGSDITSEGLWAALEHSTGKPIKKIAVGWTEQPGFPLIKVTSQCVKGNRVISLEQIPFNSAQRGMASTQWIVPVGIRSTVNSNEVKYALLDKLSNNFDLAGCSGVIQANAGNVGFYRVLYEPALFSDLQSNIEKLPESDRLNLVSDTWALVESGSLPGSAYFDLLESMHGDNAFAAWQIVLGTGETTGALKLIDRLEQGRPGREAYQRYICSLFSPKFQEVGWDQRPGENAEQAGYRALLIETLGFFGDRDVIDESFKRFQNFRENPSSLTPGLRSAVIAIVGRYGSQTVNHELLSIAGNSGSVEEKRMYLRALGAALDPDSMRETLQYLVSGEVSSNDLFLALETIAAESEQADIVWSFAVEHLKEIQYRVGPLRQTQLLSAIATGFTENQRADEVLAFAQACLPSTALVKLQNSIDEIRFRAGLKAKILPTIDDSIKAKLEVNRDSTARHP